MKNILKIALVFVVLIQIADLQSAWKRQASSAGRAATSRVGGISSRTFTSAGSRTSCPLKSQSIARSLSTETSAPSSLRASLRELGAQTRGIASRHYGKLATGGAVTAVTGAAAYDRIKTKAALEKWQIKDKEEKEKKERQQVNLRKFTSLINALDNNETRMPDSKEDIQKRLREKESLNKELLEVIKALQADKLISEQAVFYDRFNGRELLLYETPLMIVLESGLKSKTKEDLVSLLIEHGAKPGLNELTRAITANSSFFPTFEYLQKSISRLDPNTNNELIAKFLPFFDGATLRNVGDVINAKIKQVESWQSLSDVDEIASHLRELKGMIDKNRNTAEYAKIILKKEMD